MSKLKEAGFNPGLNSYGKIAFQIYDDSDIKQNFQKAINKIKKLNFDNSKSKQIIFILGLYEVIKQSFPTKGRGNLLTGTEGELRGLAMDYLIKSQINILGGKKNTFKDHTVLPKLKKLVTSDTKELFEGFYKFLKENKFENSDLFFFFENNLAGSFHTHQHWIKYLEKEENFKKILFNADNLVKFIRGMLGVNNTIISRVKGQLDLLYEFTRHNGILVQSTQDGKRIDHLFANDYSSPHKVNARDQFTLIFGPRLETNLSNFQIQLKISYGSNLRRAFIQSLENIICHINEFVKLRHPGSGGRGLSYIFSPRSNPNIKTSQIAQVITVMGFPRFDNDSIKDGLSSIKQMAKLNRDKYWLKAPDLYGFSLDLNNLKIVHQSDPLKILKLDIAILQEIIYFDNHFESSYAKNYV